MRAEEGKTKRLVRAARSGDTSAKHELFRLYAPIAMRVALSVAGNNRSDAEDLVHDAFVTCLLRLDDLRDPEAFGGWLMKCVKNLGLNRRARDNTRARLSQDPINGDGAEDSALGPYELFERKQREALVHQAIAKLPDDAMKETARMYYFEEAESAETVARRLNTNKSTVTTRLDRFRQRLKKEILREIAKTVGRPGETWVEGAL